MSISLNAQCLLVDIQGSSVVAALVVDQANHSKSGGDVGVNWSTTAIDEITIIWEECDVCSSNNHGMAIGGIDFCSGLLFLIFSEYLYHRTIA